MTFRIKFYDFDSEFHHVFIWYLAIPGNIHLPMDHTDMGTQIVQDFQEKQQQFMQDSNGLNGFPGILVKIHKMLEKLTEFQ